MVLSEADFVDIQHGLVHGRYSVDRRRDLRVAPGDLQRQPVRKRYVLGCAWGSVSPQPGAEVCVLS